MTSDAKTVLEYLNNLPEDRKAPMENLRNTILENLPEGFAEVIFCGSIGYVVPHSIYPAGYHCNPKLPLGLMNIASQKHFIALYHMGLYGDPLLLKWFSEQYPKHCKTKLDMGKSCVRFKKFDQIPLELIAELTRKITVKDWISINEKALKR
jgi:hypothetical protein